MLLTGPPVEADGRSAVPDPRYVITIGAGCGAAIAAPLDDAGAAALARSFAALADPVRLRLLSLLATAAAGEVCVCDLTAPVGKSQPTVSHHLRILTDAGLVIGRKEGRWVQYRLVPERFHDLCAALMAPIR